MAKRNTHTDYTVDVIAKIIRDVREKVVEEPMYERSLSSSQDDRRQGPDQARSPTTNSAKVDIDSSTGRRRSFAEQLSERSSGVTAPTHEQDHGIDH